MDYWNIWQWINEYTINFYLENGEIKKWKFIIETNYKKIDLGENIIYLDDSSKSNYFSESKWNIYINIDEYLNLYKEKYNILIRNNNNFLVSNWMLIYNKEWKYLLEVTNINWPESFGDSYNIDLYKYNWSIIMDSFPIIWTSSWWPYLVPFVYYKDTQELEFITSYGDICGFGFSKKVYNINNKNYSLVVDGTDSKVSVRYLDNKLEIFTEHKEINEDNIKFLGLKFKFFEKRDNNFTLKDEWYIFKSDEILDKNNRVCTFISFSTQIDYKTKNLSIELKDKIYNWDLDDLSKQK